MKSSNSDLEQWKFFAKTDLDSANIILRESNNFHIVVFHAQQSVEKLLKWYILKENRDIVYIHDLLELLKVARVENISQKLLEGASYLMDLYSACRYPSGDQIGKLEAIESINIAELFFKEFA